MEKQTLEATPELNALIVAETEQFPDRLPPVSILGAILSRDDLENAKRVLQSWNTEINGLMVRVSQAASVVPLERAQFTTSCILQEGIKDDAALQNADRVLNDLKSQASEWESVWKPKTEADYSVYKIGSEERQRGKGVLDDCVKKLKTLMGKYVDAKREAAEREQERLRREAEAAQKAALAEARRLAERGEVEKARMVETMAATAIAPVVPDATPKLAGSHITGTWAVTVTDLQAFVKGVADGVIPLEAIEPNFTFLRKRALENKGLSWPGVLAERVTTFARSRS